MRREAPEFCPPDDAPLLQGGQARSESELERDAKLVDFCIRAACLAVIVACMVAAMRGGTL